MRTIKFKDLNFGKNRNLLFYPFNWKLNENTYFCSGKLGSTRLKNKILKMLLTKLQQ